MLKMPPRTRNRAAPSIYLSVLSGRVSGGARGCYPSPSRCRVGRPTVYCTEPPGHFSPCGTPSLMQPITTRLVTAGEGIHSWN